MTHMHCVCTETKWYQRWEPDDWIVLCVASIFPLGMIAATVVFLVGC